MHCNIRQADSEVAKQVAMGDYTDNKMKQHDIILFCTCYIQVAPCLLELIDRSLGFVAIFSLVRFSC